MLMLVAAACGPEDAPREGYVELEDTRLYYQVMGSGEPLMVVHGGPLLDHGYMEPWLKELSSDYLLVFMDQRLSGRSSPESDSANITLDRFTEDIEAVRRHLELDRVHLLGHSWGGFLAMRYALDHPEALRSLTLVSPLPPSTAHWGKEQQALASRLDSSYLRVRDSLSATPAFRSGEPGARVKLLRHAFRPQFHNPDIAEGLELYMPEDYQGRSQMFGLLVGELSSFNLYPQLDSLRTPALLIYGEGEPSAAISGDTLAQVLPEAHLELLERSGHFSFMERPERFMELLRNFLSRH